MAVRGVSPPPHAQMDRAVAALTLIRTGVFMFAVLSIPAESSRY
jgi:hypothetical protein